MSDLKKCSTCKIEKLLKEFNKNKTKKDGLSTFCRECSCNHNKKYYRCNRAHQKEAIKRLRQIRVLVAREALFKFLDGAKCVDCGEDDLLVLDLDHVRGKKVAGVTTLVAQGVSLVRIVEEINKCEVRCANCHRRKTAQEQNTYRWQLIQGRRGATGSAPDF